jgi:hypothetical protein
VEKVVERVAINFAVLGRRAASSGQMASSKSWLLHDMEGWGSGGDNQVISRPSAKW